MRGIYIFDFFSLYFWRLICRSFFFASFPFQALLCNVCAEARPLHHTRTHSAERERERERERSRAEEIAKEFEGGFDWRNGWRRWRLGRTPEGGTQGRRRSGCQALVLQQAWRHACPWRLQTLIAFFVSFFGPLLLLPVSISPLHAFACISRRSFRAPESGLPPIGVACEIVSRDEGGPVDKPIICSKGLPCILGRRLFNL